jgi:hypothetical protein
MKSLTHITSCTDIHYISKFPMISGTLLYGRKKKLTARRAMVARCMTHIAANNPRCIDNARPTVCFPPIRNATKISWKRKRHSDLARHDATRNSRRAPRRANGSASSELEADGLLHSVDHGDQGDCGSLFDVLIQWRIGQTASLALVAFGFGSLAVGMVSLVMLLSR